ncbi:ceramide phosphoethanolamine synthase [Sitophilus oryzae]|uniref:Ceramide phosphoethanolamine synthase n=1 Tax=Sitophilus oryzae TaxID=7048 RepID=A0A6J2YGR5_SITOR|nr:ceramide phosphoethanolamine synthase [Sitophilus oryzae]XP_030762622.1 ceramide phosphoethanolamine synthase [Sitophilus oryzae]XP_030762623.1 ceramide phosphoethanolamine synthase [Sitophilus oryzae]
MVGPSSQISKFLLLLLMLILIYYTMMDFYLYIRIKNYPINRIAQRENMTDVKYSDVTWINCNINPLCEVTVKALLLDHTNYYLFAPLVTIADNGLNISSISFITPNAISYFHVLIAVISAKCVSSDNLPYRRIGVVLFELRTWLDDLDGHVARVRKHIKGEHSEIGTAGYYIDGICDAIGCTALILGILIFFKNNPPRRGYMQLPTSNETKENTYCTKVAMKKVYKKLGCFTLQLIISSTAWNRYIALYQDLLERDNVNDVEFTKQKIVITSSFFYTVCWLWRIVNIHNMLHCLLLAIFCDKLWEFLCYVQYIGYGLLFSLVCITEVHFIDAKSYIFNRLTDVEEGMLKIQ